MEQYWADGCWHLGGNCTAKPRGNGKSFVQTMSINLPSQAVTWVWVTAQAWFSLCQGKVLSQGTNYTLAWLYYPIYAEQPTALQKGRDQSVLPLPGAGAHSGGLREPADVSARPCLKSHGDQGMLPRTGQKQMSLLSSGRARQIQPHLTSLGKWCSKLVWKPFWNIWRARRWLGVISEDKIMPDQHFSLLQWNDPPASHLWWGKNRGCLPGL